MDDPIAAAVSAAAELARHGGFTSAVANHSDDIEGIGGHQNLASVASVAANITMQVSSASALALTIPADKGGGGYASDDEDDDEDDGDLDSNNGVDAERRINRSRERNREHAKKTRVSGQKHP
jgi:hypothetical protein